MPDQTEIPELELAGNYWLKQFEDEIPALEFQSEIPRLAETAGVFSNITIAIAPTIVAGITKISEALGGTLQVGLLAFVNLLLYRYTGQRDIVIGTPAGGLEDPLRQASAEDVYNNILPLRFRFDDAESYEQLFLKTKEVTLGAFENRSYPIEDLIEALKLPRNLNRNPLFNVTVSLQKAAETPDAGRLLNGSYADVSERGQRSIVGSDINFLFFRSSNRLDLSLQYRSDCYGIEQMKRLASHLDIIMEAVVTNPKQSLAEIDFLTSQDKTLLLEEFNNTTIEFPSDKTIVDLFEEQVKKTPANRAVIFEGVQLNYHELNCLSNQFGDYLRKNYSIKPDDLVGIKLERSEWMVIVIMGILKSGGAYVPIAPDYPQERIDYLVMDSACKVLIDPQQLEIFNRSKDKYSQENQSVGLRPNHLAYCIYTSGSTGNPKGCLLQHGGLVNRLTWMQKAYPLTDQDVILQKTTFSFDVSVWELLWWALHGATVCMLQPGGEKSPEVIAETIDKHHVTVMHFVPSMLSVFLEYLENDRTKLCQLKGLRQVFTSGEALTLNQAERFNELFTGTALMNLYGPTEASIDVTYFDCKKENLGSSVPIGKPIDNTQIYIVDKFRNLLPLGAIGEICLGGVGLARGYLNRPDLTAEKFIANPFREGERIYRTGDLGKWRPDGNIEYLGRIDDQVKIRGFRIELDEIASVLQKHPNVKDAVVVARTVKRQDKELVAYFTGNSGALELKEYLREQLPSYMIPVYYVKIEAIPLTSNGKANRKALPAPDSSAIVEAAYVVPSTAVEKALAGIWSEVLDVPVQAISVRSDFFDLGGHSIKVIRLLGLIHKRLGVKLSLKELFSESTIEKQAAAIANNDSVSYEAIAVIPELPVYQLSSSQRRLWVLDHFDGAQSAYNISCVILLEGQLDKSALVEAFEFMAERHEILRTVFREDIDGNPRQQVLDNKTNRFNLKQTDLKKSSDKKARLNQLVNEESTQRFDLAEGPLWRCHLVCLEQDKHVLIMVHHHIISDGWSMDVFRKEWCALYNAHLARKPPELPLLPIQYKDYAAWHAKQLNSDEINPHKAYWLKQFEGAVPILELPSQKERPTVKTFNGASLITTFDKHVLDGLNNIAKSIGGTLFMNLLACVNALLYRYTGQQDIVVGSPIAGRDHPDLENQIGFYVNTLALRTQFDGLGSYLELLEKIKELTLSAYEHQLYPYDELVEALKLPRNVSRNPLFDVMIVLQNSADQDAVFELNGLKTSYYEEAEYRIAQFDVNFVFSESGNGLNLLLKYNTDIYSNEQMIGLLSHLEKLMASVARDPKQSLAAIDILSKEDRHLLLNTFNDTLVDYPKEKTLVSLFEERVAISPGDIALRQSEWEMTYSELNDRSNQLADYLVGQGVKKGDNVALLVSRSFEMIISMLGILKAGCAYVPVDPQYAIEEQKYIIDSVSAVKILVDDNHPLEQLLLADLFVKLKAIDLAFCSTLNPDLQIDSTHLACIIYTPGSTGQPKGVMIEHYMAVNLISWGNATYGTGPVDRLLLINSITSDLSIYDVFGILTAGGSLVIPPKNQLNDVPNLKDIMIRERITFWNSAPRAMDDLIAELETADNSYLQNTLRIVLMSRDWIPVNLPERIRRFFPNAQVISLGGATEGTVWSTYFLVGKANAARNSIPYGRPLNNTFLYILNEKLQPQPFGVTGELYIGGVGVARGYVGEKEKTDHVFVKDPFYGKAGGRMYRTGDLARMLPDLNIELVGRMDDLVSIDGYRIELAKIEHVLRQCELVSHAAVAASTDRNNKKCLVAYLVPKGRYDRAMVIAFLKSKLPDQMIPSLWVEVDQLPLSAQGKINRSALPEFNADGQTRPQYVAPKTQMERMLVEIWQDVLKVNNVGITDDFFDLGGHSLLAVQIVNRLKKKTGKIIQISDLFKYSNIEALERLLAANNSEKALNLMVPIKPSGSKMPVYFVHGIGLNVMNFAEVAMYLDKNQPMYGIQALGLGRELPPTSMAEIAQVYVSELIKHNPSGPYAIAGYSLGGFIALEMKKQLEATGRKVRALIMIDTNANHTNSFFTLLPKKIKRHCNKWLNFFISFLSHPKQTIENWEKAILEEREYRYDAIKLALQSGDRDYYNLLKKIKRIYNRAYENSRITPFDDYVYLFRANVCIHYTDDKQYLGWRKYALKGVKEYLLPGDHRTMMLKPNADEFARALQKVLDNC